MSAPNRTARPRLSDSRAAAFEDVQLGHAGRIINLDRRNSNTVDVSRIMKEKPNFPRRTWRMVSQNVSHLLDLLLGGAHRPQTPFGRPGHLVIRSVFGTEELRLTDTCVANTCLGDGDRPVTITQRHYDHNFIDGPSIRSSSKASSSSSEFTVRCGGAV